MYKKNVSLARKDLISNKTDEELFKDFKQCLLKDPLFVKYFVRKYTPQNQNSAFSEIGILKASTVLRWRTNNFSKDDEKLFKDFKEFLLEDTDFTVNYKQALTRMELWDRNYEKTFGKP